MKFKNPFGFRPGPVTLWTTAIYLAVTIPLIFVHETVPSPPSGHSLKPGLNLTEAWLDLQTITRHYHPYNSRQNSEVREYLLERSKDILKRNNIDYKIETAGGVLWDDRYQSPPSQHIETTDSVRPRGATIFDDRTSNVTWAAGSLLRSAKGPTSWSAHYFEGDNFYVYIHGKDDPEGDWWASESGGNLPEYQKTGGVLVNCHFDSVATGFGATDDGMSCVSMLQLLSYFTLEGKQPRNGIILLFNNAEEDGLYGARAFGYSPLLKFVHTFVNLEGAGAGGRALLFRATDLQIAKAYAKSPYPFGTTIAANAFERGVIKSGTDYEVFARDFGQRGMDIAFYEPRARYHTEEDDTRHTSVNSIWHMLSAALASTERLSEITSTKFNGDRGDGNKHFVQNGKPTEGVWFDWYGSAWSAFPLRGLFAWSLTLLIATPLALAIVTYMLVRKDKYYFFAGDITLHEFEEPVFISGWRGFFRFPVALVFAVGLTVLSVLLVLKVNPLIIYSSAYAVWAMSLSIFYFSFWLIVRGANFVRPSALHRGHSLIWLFVLSWVFQVIAAIAEDRMHIGALYWTPFFHTAIFLSLFISLVEQFALPGKQEFAQNFRDEPPAPAQNGAHTENPATEEEEDGEEGETEEGGDEEEATETTPLRAGEDGYGSNEQITTFTGTYRRSAALADNAAAPKLRSYPPYEFEQAWSGRLPTWTWFVQFLLLAPVYVILAGNIGLVLMSGTAMTGSDTGSFSTPLMGVGILSIFLLLPLTPFLHRVTHHIPVFLLLVFVSTFIYNLVAFPFSVNHRYKFFFQEVIDLDAGTDYVTITGLNDYIHPVISSLPTAAGQSLKCSDSTGRLGLTTCRYDTSSRPANVVDGIDPSKLIKVTTSKASNGKTAKVVIDALETKMCVVDFSQPVFAFSVKDSAPADRRFGGVPRDGLKRISLWRREWEGPWDVTLQLTQDGHLLESGRLSTDPKEEDGTLEGGVTAEAAELEMTVRCSYSDANDATTIPSLHEISQYMPGWATVTKFSVALVEVKKTYTVK